MNPARHHYPAATRWATIAGYSRAVRIGPLIEVSGTVSLGTDGEPHGVGHAGAQTHRILEIILEAVEALGGSAEDIVRTRIFVTDINHWEAVGQVHGKFFAHIRPATTIVEVAALIAPEFLVEIEATAYVPSLA